MIPWRLSGNACLAALVIGSLMMSPSGTVLLQADGMTFSVTFDRNGPHREARQAQVRAKFVNVGFGIDNDVVTAKLEPAVHPGNGLYAIGSSHESFACILSGRTGLKVQQCHDICEVVTRAVSQLIKQKLAVLNGYRQIDEPDVQRLDDE